MIVQRLRQAWWQYRGEQPIATTFWPRDYPQNAERHVNGRSYRITRYVRSMSDPRFFEVWGRAIAPQSVRKHGHVAREHSLRRAA